MDRPCEGKGGVKPSVVVAGVVVRARARTAGVFGTGAGTAGVVGTGARTAGVVGRRASVVPRIVRGRRSRRWTLPDPAVVVPTGRGRGHGTVRPREPWLDDAADIAGERERPEGDRHRHHEAADAEHDRPYDPLHMATVAGATLRAG
jgi:hypothetical protein